MSLPYINNTVLNRFLLKLFSLSKNYYKTITITLTSLHGFHQLISEPNHFLPASTSCDDLIFTDQSNLVVDSGAHSPLNPK